MIRSVLDEPALFLFSAFSVNIKLLFGNHLFLKSYKT